MTDMKKLLVVEDDKNLGFLLSTQLKNKGFDVHLAKDGMEGLKMFNENIYDLCILDIMLPKLDGLSLAKEIRKLNEVIPFVFLTARNLKSDKIVGYEIGCDDYLTKPFDIDELIFKINVIIKRTGTGKVKQENIFTVGSLTLSVLERSVSKDSERISLSLKEATLLKLLFENVNEVVSRKVLMIEAWGNDDFFTSKSLDVHLTKIRKVLSLDESLKLLNIHGFGYKLVDNLKGNQTLVR